MILGIYGYQDSGKTTVVEGLVASLVKGGLKVASVKHSAHADVADEEGKDTWRHSRAGSDPVALMTSEGTVVRIRGEVPVEKIVGMLEGAFSPDVVIIEGLKDGPYPKVALGDIKPRDGTVLSNPTVTELTHYVTKEVLFERALGSLPGLDCHKCGLDCQSMARAIAEGRRKPKDCKELPSRGVMITVGGKRIATGTFVSEIVDDTVRGMLSSLKGYEPGKEVEIRLRPEGRKAKARKSKRV
ncbi:MAG: molybdopterin-guanine dinucleotide biosynthesis adapter protein [Candidatus Thermoplasmatota archaeon]|nr:molybdopterin-guanine dinucleotide biosynthesis adapter protein [Candidatus Thermoplasmatota archaeon]